MKTATPMYCMCTFSLFNTKPIACNNDDKRIYLDAYVKTREREARKNAGINVV